MAWSGATRLAGGVAIGFWSETLDNLVWSKDNIIAVGGNEYTSLLIPRLRSAGADNKRWDRVNIKTSSFTETEVPLQFPLSWRNFSIGEEMSESFVHSLDWSPPGLGKHKRSVLAVLTSNHVLSLWECVGKPEIASDWVRACVVNHSLEAFFSSQNPDSPETEQEKLERIKSRQRIRSFSWSQAPQISLKTGNSGASTTKTPYLAVSNDRGDVLIFQIHSPHDLMAPENQQWTLTTAASFRVDVQRARKSPLAACLPVAFQCREPFVDQLAWSPWATDASGAPTSILAFTSQTSLQCRLIRLKDKDESTKVEVGPTLPLLRNEPNASPAGPMRWVPRLRDDKEACLVFATSKALFTVYAQPGVGTAIQHSVRGLDNTWDEVAGLSFTQDGMEQSILHVAYHTGSGSDKVTEWALPFTTESRSSTSLWQQRLLQEESKFSKDNDLARSAMTRTHGLCSAPLGDVVAVNISHHPSDGVEYATNSDQVSSIIISSAQEDEHNGLLSSPGSPSHSYEITAEALLSSLQSVSIQQSHANIDQDFLLAHVLHLLDLTDAPTNQQSQAPITEDTHPETIVRQLRQNILFSRDSVVSRLKQLFRFMDGVIPKTPPLDAAIVRRLVTEVARLPHFLADASPLSHNIMQLHCMILSKLDARAAGEQPHTSAAEDEELEKCDICNTNITFESLRWARCTNNHQFPRCGLSFLSIQTPGTAKSCNICNAQYLNEYMIPGLQTAQANNGAKLESGTGGGHLMQGDTNQEPLISLARILFVACDRCICCGGKFTG